VWREKERIWIKKKEENGLRSDNSPPINREPRRKILDRGWIGSPSRDVGKRPINATKED
jgi:hypothetical protein